MDLKNEPYHPISCDFHSELELLALRRSVCEIVLLEDEKETVLPSIIEDLFARSGEEFLLLSGGREIRLDKIISVNGMKLSSYC